MSSSLLAVRPDTVVAETIGDEKMLIDTLSIGGGRYTDLVPPESA